MSHAKIILILILYTVLIQNTRGTQLGVENDSSRPRVNNYDY